MDKKRLYIIILTSVTALSAAALFFCGYRADLKSLAAEQLRAETEAIIAETERIKLEKDTLEAQISDIDTELSTKTTINNYYMEYKKTHDDLYDEVEKLRERSRALDEEINKKQSELDSLSKINTGKKGRVYNLTTGETYSCPDKIPAARYTASGSGTFIVTSSSGKARISQNLDTAYEHSYTFDLAEKERIKVTGNVTLTELK